MRRWFHTNEDLMIVWSVFIAGLFVGPESFATTKQPSRLREMMFDVLSQG